MTIKNKFNESPIFPHRHPKRSNKTFATYAKQPLFTDKKEMSPECWATVRTPILG